MEQTQIVMATTDERGRISVRRNINPPGPFDLKPQLWARIVSPENVMIHATVTVQPDDEDEPQIAAVSIDGTARLVDSGSTKRAGKWKLSGGDNEITISGFTKPPTPNTEISVEITAKIGG